MNLSRTSNIAKNFGKKMPNNSASILNQRIGKREMKGGWFIFREG